MFGEYAESDPIAASWGAQCSCKHVYIEVNAVLCEGASCVSAL